MAADTKPTSNIDYDALQGPVLSLPPAIHPSTASVISGTHVTLRRLSYGHDLKLLYNCIGGAENDYLWVRLHGADMNIGAVVVGADRVVRNVDTANKIGTYQLAVLARRRRPSTRDADRRWHQDRGAQGRGAHADQRRRHRSRRGGGCLQHGEGGHC